MAATDTELMALKNQAGPAPLDTTVTEAEEHE
jgi:hypothetical protein